MKVKKSPENPGCNSSGLLLTSMSLIQHSR